MSPPPDPPAAEARAADIRAVATRAGVAISTVSRFLNGKKRLSAATEQRISEAVRHLGYAPNRVARSLRLKRTMTLGLLLPDSSNPFFSDLIKGAEDAAREAGFALILFNSNEDREREQAHLGAMQSLRCDGALVIVAARGPDEDQRRLHLSTCPLPMVFVDRLPGIDADTVAADNVHGGYEATRHLLRLGHRRIGLVSSAYDIPSHHDRREGHAAALAEAGLPHDPALEVRVPLNVGEGTAGAARLLALPQRPTALFATSNSLTIGAVAAIHARGLRCPADVSVVGYDSYDWQEVFAPRLTTIKQPAYLIGRRACELLLGRVTGKRTAGAETVILRGTLVVRDSCAPPDSMKTGPG